ncbi:hypothetical protein HZB88_05145 [archaeon]|nr:hypothetical protein [archaeon]
MIEVIGLGEVGFATLQEIVKKTEEQVYGVDINPGLLPEIRNKGYNNVGTELKKADTYIIAVYTTGQVNSVLRKIQDLFSSGNSPISRKHKSPLVCIESTLDPARLGEIKTFNYLFFRLDIVSFPHRYNPNDPKHHVFNLDRVLGGVTEEGTGRAVEFYKQFMDEKLIHVASFETSALSKVLENAYRFLEIAFAESARMDCESQGILFEPIRKIANRIEPIRKIANRKERLHIKEARDGIYGKCLPKDAELLCNFLKNDFLKLAIDLDKRYKRWQNSLNSMRRGVMHPKGDEQSYLPSDLKQIYQFVEYVLSKSLKMDFEEQGFDLRVIRNAANTKWNINIKNPDRRQGSLESQMQELKLNSGIFLRNEFLEQARRVHEKYLEYCKDAQCLTKRQ